MKALQYDDYVFTHTKYNLFAPEIGFDIFRFGNEKIVERQDTIQEIPINERGKNRNGKL